MDILDNLRNYLNSVCTKEKINLPHIFKIENAKIAKYYFVMRLSKKARQSFVDEILKNGESYGLKLISDRDSYFMIEMI